MKDYYSKNSESFIKNTQDCDMSELYGFFEKYLPQKSKTILDLGFGSGRDSLYFMNKYEVYSVDPTKEFCEYGKNIGLKNVIQGTAQELEFSNFFDGIWACASLLHVPTSELSQAFEKCDESLKKGGIMYCSFKYGDYEGERSDRYYTDLTEDKLTKFLDGTSFVIVDTKITIDVRPDRSEKWLNCILVKK